MSRRVVAGDLLRGSMAGLLFVLGSVAALTVLAWPRPTAPLPPPALPLRAWEAAAIAAQQARLAAAAPKGEAVDALRRAERDQGLREGAPASQESAGVGRRHVLSSLAAVAREHGDGALDTLRAEAVERFVAALDGTLPEVERRWVVGHFPAVAARYGAMDAGGGEAAPRAVLRAMYAARWNAAHGLAPTRGLGPAALRAYHGWLAFEARSAPPDARLAALDAFVEAGGEAPAGARGALLAAAGRWGEAAEAFASDHAATGSVRFRNHAMFCVDAAAR